jgi:Tol biopolymer transport system component/tRNA A-37 threonylcarbamoyl transferase component Bud32
VTDPRARLASALADRYQIERELGQGGMATVYLAQDIRHERRVAVKLLRPELAAVIGAERFLQEIKTTANLQHPHILPLHDSGVADGLLFYVMPYVEGESLRDLLAREKQLDITQAIELSRQVASALDYAHRQGVIHRDIKPENVLIHDGQALVADFGIALAVSSAGSGSRMTETGMSLGTPQYMSPEQAMGDREINARSDIYSLGAMLYEMLAGDPPYTGSTAQAIVAKVITEKATPVTSLRETVPSNVSAALQKALAKLPADRFHSAAEFAEALINPSFVTTGSTPSATGVMVPGRGPRRWLWPALTAVFAGVAIWAMLRPEPPRPVARYGLAFPKDQELRNRTWHTFGMAWDGSWLAYVGPGPTPAQDQLWVKSRGQFEATLLAGTVDAWAPVASPDGQWIAFLGIGPNQLRKIPVVGGAPITLADSTQGADASIPTWGDDDVLTYVDRQWRLRRVSGNGGPSTVAWTPPAERYAALPTALPKGRGVLFLLCDQNCRSVSDVWVLDLRTGEARQLVPGALQAWYAAGRLVYVRQDGGVFTQAFDLDKLVPLGAAIPVLDGVQVDGPVPKITLGPDGSLLYLRGPGGGAGTTQEAVWVSRDGRATPVDSTWGFSLGANPGWALSPDGRQLAIALSTEAGDHIWVKELDHGPVSRITFDSAGDARPRWMPDGRTVSYLSPRGAKGNQALFARRGDGTGAEELKLETDHPIWETVWSQDGKWVVIRTGGIAGAQGQRDVYAMQVGVDSAPRPLLVTPADERAITLSPDGRWLAYESDETGRDEVYVRPFPDVESGKWQVSTAGGDLPLWAHSGRELFYRSPTGEMMVAPVSVSGDRGFAVADRKVLFKFGPEYPGNTNYTAWDMSPDDQRFLLVRSRGGAQTERNSSLILVTNWFEELRAKTRK